MGFLRARSEHLYGRFVRVHDLLSCHPVTQGIDQGLQLHARHTNPLGQRRTWNRQASSTENRFLTVKRKMINELRNHDVGKQPGSRDAFVDNLRRYWRLDQRFAVIAYPLATNMTLDGKHARRVIQLLADIFTDMLECAAAWAVGVIRFVMDQRARELCRQRRALGLLLFFGCRWR